MLKFVLLDNYFSDLFTEVQIWYWKSFKFGIRRVFRKVKSLPRWTFFNTNKKLLKNRNWIFPVVPYFTRKLDFAANILTKTNSNIQNSMVMFDRKYSFRGIRSKKSKLTVWPEIWYFEYLKHLEFNGGVHIFLKL